MFAETVTVANAGPSSASQVLTGLRLPSGVTVTSTNGGSLLGDVV